MEIRSRESSVAEDLPSWCRMTGNDLVSQGRKGESRSFRIRKGGKPAAVEAPRLRLPDAPSVPSTSVPEIRPLSVMGIGSWPRPGWMLRAIHEHLEKRLSGSEFEETARDAVRKSVEAQVRAGVDVVTDGEQRRDSA